MVWQGPGGPQRPHLSTNPSGRLAREWQPLVLALLDERAGDELTVKEIALALGEALGEHPPDGTRGTFYAAVRQLGDAGLINRRRLGADGFRQHVTYSANPLRDLSRTTADARRPRRKLVPAAEVEQVPADRDFLGRECLTVVRATCPCGRSREIRSWAWAGAGYFVCDACGAGVTRP